MRTDKLLSPLMAPDFPHWKKSIIPDVAAKPIALLGSQPILVKTFLMYPQFGEHKAAQ